MADTGVFPRPRPGASPRSRPRAREWARWAVPATVFAITAAAYIAFAAWQWSQYTVRSWDLSIFAQLLDRYATLQPPIVSVKGEGFNLLGDHFHPLLALLAPVYALFPHAFTLLVAQALCFAGAAGVFATTARRRLGTARGLLLGLAFGFAWGLQYAAEAQFHEIALGVPLCTLSLCALIDRRPLAAAVWAAPLVWVKEDLGLTVAVIGVLIALRSRRALGVWVSVWGVFWFGLATLVVLPSLNPNREWAYVGTANPLALLADPGALFHSSKGVTLLLLVAVTGGMLFRSPVAFVLLPTLAWRFLSTNHGYWGHTWHYSAMLMPIVFVALLDAIARGPASRWAWLRAYSRHAAAIAVAVAVILLPTLPLRVVVDPAAWAPPPRAAAAAQVIDAVPRGASVETDIGLMSYVVDGRAVFWIGNANPAPDCILVDHAGGGTPAEWGDVAAVAELLHPEERYAVRAAVEGYELACRADAGDPAPR